MVKAMRQIKYKAKRKDNGEWIEGCLCKSHCGIECIQTYEDTDDEEVVMYIPVDHETVCQFTGVEDKNGTPIYEGDDVEYDNGVISFIRTIEWRKGALRFGDDNLLYFFEEKYLKVLNSKFDKETAK